MSKQSQNQGPDLDKKSQAKQEAVVSNEQAGAQGAPFGSSGDFVAPASPPSIEGHSAQLSASNLQTVQRQAMAAQLGRQGGNQYLQRVMIQMKRDKQKSAVAESAQTGVVQRWPWKAKGKTKKAKKGQLEEMSSGDPATIADEVEAMLTSSDEEIFINAADKLYGISIPDLKKPALKDKIDNVYGTKWEVAQAIFE